MVEIKLQFKSVEEAITVLGKMAGLGEKKAPQAPAAIGTAAQAGATSDTAAPSTQATTKGRKPRADAGQARGPNARTAQSNAETKGNIDSESRSTLESASNGSAAIAPSVDSVSPSVSAPETAAPAPVEADKAQPPGATPDAAAPATIEQCQAALTEVFEKKGAPIAMAVLSRFGTKRIKEMLPVSYADFITKCNAVLAGEEV